MRNISAHWWGIMCGHFLIVTLLCSWTYHPCYTDKTPAMKCQCTCIHTCQRAYAMGFLCSFAGGELNVLNCWNNQKHLCVEDVGAKQLSREAHTSPVVPWPCQAFSAWGAQLGTLAAHSCHASSSARDLVEAIHWGTVLDTPHPRKEGWFCSEEMGYSINSFTIKWGYYKNTHTLWKDMRRRNGNPIHFTRYDVKSMFISPILCNDRRKMGISLV